MKIDEALKKAQKAYTDAFIEAHAGRSESIDQARSAGNDAFRASLRESGLTIARLEPTENEIKNARLAVGDSNEVSALCEEFCGYGWDSDFARVYRAMLDAQAADKRDAP